MEEKEEEPVHRIAVSTDSRESPIEEEDDDISRLRVFTPAGTFCIRMLLEDMDAIMMIDEDNFFGFCYLCNQCKIKFYI